MDDPLFVAIDIGTTGARACAVDPAGRFRGEAREPYCTSTPRPGWAEQSPDDWRRAGLDALTQLVAADGIRPEAVRAIGLTGQCPTVAPFDRARRPVGPGLLYRDNRAVAEAAAMRDRLGDEAMHARTGHLPSAFHVGPKILWLRAHEPDTFAAADCYLQPRDVILHALTGVTATDETHANSTLFFDLRAHRWAGDLLEAFSLGSELFPRVLASWETAGELGRDIGDRTGIPADCPVVIGAADSQCAAFGSDVMGPGPISEMAGASSCLNSVIAEPAADVRITHYSYVTAEWYCTELGVNTTGGALTWAVEHLGFDGFQALEAGARAARDRLCATAGGDPRLLAPLFMPYLGDGDRDDPTLRAAFIGLSDRHGRDELAYAVLEGVAFAVAETVSILRESGSPLTELRVGGGGARMATLGQIKSDVLGVPVVHLEHDSAPVGVALLAAGSCGYDAEARTALAANLERARRLEPDRRCADLTADRYHWFLQVRESTAVRIQ